eukprot:TRINITY_DN19094_c0_g1_i3.p1 TRINITY_DN19094_c0_g1~~TRINITY_DN19094_c0_g1_i3.p1  ORF type:complete len:1028 (-),score=301.07 TRINITY_DN19094_c0_g1_i3:126-3209(-)
MDYYATLRNDYIHKAMYPDDPMRVDWIPKGPPTGTLTIKPKDRCSPRFVTKIEGSAVEESCKVFFEGIVDAQPQPKFSWYFNDEPIVPGQKGFEEAEIHDSRKMSTLILKYAREHHMGKYSLQSSNQLGTVECSCDLIVRKKQFPPVFWQRLYNVSGEKDSTRFVGGVEVGGWPVPVVYWYKVMEDGTEVEVTTKTHTENWNGNPNAYVPSSRVEVRQIDQIRHCIIFQQVSEGDSGLYRVRAVNCLGEAECEAELNFDGVGDAGNDLYLPPLRREKRSLTWRDEDQRKKPFVGYNDPQLSPEDMEAMKNKSGLVPLSRITEYFASLPDYVPSSKFNSMDRIPFKAGVDEHDYKPDRKGGNPGWPTKFEAGEIIHRGYNTDCSGRILPLWYNQADQRARDSSDWRWKPVHPDLYVPDIPPEVASPDPPPVWESLDDIRMLIEYLRSMGCRVSHEEEIRQYEKKDDLGNIAHVKVKDNKDTISEKCEKKETHQNKKFNYLASSKSEQFSKETRTEHLAKTADVKKMWEDKLDKNVTGAQANAAEFTSQFMKPIHHKKENLSFPELEKISQPPPALPPKTKIMHSPSRHVFSPTESLDSNGTGTASVKTVEFIPVKEKVKLIAAQQEELNRREEASAAQGSENVKHKGVRILPPSPVTVRKMSVEEELHHYDTVVSRTTPVTQLMEIAQKPERPPPPSEADYSTEQSISSSQARMQTSSISQVSSSYKQQAEAVREETISQVTVPGWANMEQEKMKTEHLERSSAKFNVDQAFDQLISETEHLASNEELLLSQLETQTVSQSFQSSSVTNKMTSTSLSTESYQQSLTADAKYSSQSEECRRSFEEAELEAMAVESQSSRTFSKQSSMVEAGSVQSFVYQEGSANSFQSLSQVHKESSDVMSATSLHSSSDAFGSRKPLKSNSFVRTPDTFTTAQSAPSTPMSQRRRLRINQSPRPLDSDNRPRYREQVSGNAFQPGFYRPPPEDSSKAPMFQLLRKNNSQSNILVKSEADLTVRKSQASSMAYEGDSES